jgi:hypothetical protein
MTSSLVWRMCRGGATYWRKTEVGSYMYYRSLKILSTVKSLACPTIDPENGWLEDALLTANMDTCGQDLEA